jgi:S1-C subfamily serine protease
MIANSASAQKLRPYGIGTGFAISADGQFVTNNHVVTFKGKNKKGEVVRGQCRALQLKGKAYNGRAKIVARDPINDIALIRLVSNAARGPSPNTSTHGQGRSGNSLAQMLEPRPNRPQPFSSGSGGGAMGTNGGSHVLLFTGKLRPGSRLSVIGFPLGETVSDQLKITTGSVVATVGGANNTNQFQLDAAAYKGSSGGPVLDAAGNLIGILSAGISGKEGFSFAIKATTLSRFLESHDAGFQTAGAGAKMDAADIYEQAKRYTVLIRCFV